MILIASVVLVLRVAVAVTGLYTHAPTGCDIVILGKPDDEHWSSTHAFQDAIEATVQTRDRDWKEFRLVFESEDEQPTGYLQMRKRGNATDITLRNWGSSESSSQREELQTPAQAENLFVRWTTIALRRSNNTLHVTVGKTIEKTFTVNTEPFKFVYAYVPAHQYIRVGFGCKRGCQIHTLNGTSSGESWTPSIEIKSRVTLALKSPAGDPWQEIDVEFESQTGANVGTLQLLREGGSSVTFTLSSWPTTVHSDRQKTVSHKSQGALNNLLQLQDWVYVNVSAGESVRVALKDSSVVFKKLNARAFKKLYVRVPDGQDLQVAFNCGKAQRVAQTAGTAAPEPEKSNTKVTIVALVLLGLLIGVAIFWCTGRKKRNAEVKKLEEQAEEEGEGEDQALSRRCQECGDPIENEEAVSGAAPCEETEEEWEMITRGDSDRCRECGDVIDRDEREPREKEGAPLPEEECVCSTEEVEK